MARKRTKKNLSNGSGNLPNDILFNIFSRLPAKSICRFKSVCKNWLSIIHDPIFIRFYSSSSHDRNNIFMRVFGSTMNHLRQFYSIHKDGAADMYTPHCAQHGYLVLTSCNGLLCSLGRLGEIRVFNPAIEETLTLPQPIYFREKVISLREKRKSLAAVKNTGHFTWIEHCAMKEVARSFMIGFGFDSTTGKYKVVCWDRYQRSLVQIFTLGGKTWTTVKVRLLDTRKYRSAAQPAYVNGASHWYSLESSDILTFNYASGKFGGIQAPKGDTRGRNIYDIGERLCLVERFNRHVVRLWILVDYDKQEWVGREIILPFIRLEKNMDKIVDVSGLRFEKNLGATIVHVLGIGEGEILVENCEKVYLCRYNNQHQITKSIPVHEIESNSSYKMLKESLVSIKMMGCI